MKIKTTLKNPTQEVDHKKFNDKDILFNLLSFEKELTLKYSISMNEASNQQLHDLYFEIFKETRNMQRAVYNLLFKKGWYSLEIESRTKLDESYDKFIFIKEK